MWDGHFLPFVKHVTTVSFMEMERMQAGDWDILDFPALRPKAKSKLVGQIVAGSLEGFFRVGYDMHKRSHGGKPVYYFPASERTVDAYDAGDYDNDRFETFGEDFAEEDVPEYPEFDKPFNLMTGYQRGVLVDAAALLFGIMNNNDEQEAQTFYVEPDWESWAEWALSVYMLTGMYKVEENDLNEYAETFGIDPTGYSKQELIDQIVEAMEEAYEDGDLPQD